MPRPYDPKRVPPVSLREYPLDAIRAICFNRDDVYALEAKGVERERYVFPNGALVLIYPNSAVVAGVERASVEATASELATLILNRDRSTTCWHAQTFVCVVCDGNACLNCDHGHSAACATGD